jgi:hypothetical protein
MLIPERGASTVINSNVRKPVNRPVYLASAGRFVVERIVDINTNDMASSAINAHHTP